MSYVDGFVVPVKKNRIEDYRALAEKAGKLWKRHGALQYVECLADDVKTGEVTSFPLAVKLEPDEVVAFSWIVYKSREDRDRINKLVMEDPSMQMDPSTLPFDLKRMIMGGFKPVVEN
jgi:uncharacterized protein YbaA (DUF1428 family)